MMIQARIKSAWVAMRSTSRHLARATQAGRSRLGRVLLRGTLLLIGAGTASGHGGCSQTNWRPPEREKPAIKDIRPNDKQPATARCDARTWRSLLAYSDARRAEILRTHLPTLGPVDQRHAERFLSDAGLMLSPPQPRDFVVGADASMRALVLGWFAKEGSTVLMVEGTTIARGSQIIVAAKIDDSVVLRSNWSVTVDAEGHISIYPGYGSVSEVWLAPQEALAFETGVLLLMRQAQGSEFEVNEEYTKNVHTDFSMDGFVGCWGGYALDAITVGVQPDVCEDCYARAFPDWSEERIPAECQHPLWQLQFHVWHTWYNALSHRIEAMHPATRKKSRSAELEHTFQTASVER